MSHTKPTNLHAPGDNILSARAKVVASFLEAPAPLALPVFRPLAHLLPSCHNMGVCVPNAHIVHRNVPVGRNAIPARPDYQSVLPLSTEMRRSALCSLNCTRSRWWESKPCRSR